VTIVGGLTYYDVITGEGFYYEIDPSKPEGDRVTMTYNGVAVKDDDTFTVVVNNYRYNGGGDYVKYLNDHGCEFKANDPDRIVYSTQYDMIQGEDKGQARNLLADYITEQETIDPADYTIANWKIVGAK
ncbi:MAG: 5'-nucleotidase C-terminal domain-containing protein, partial [Faecousia sp.]